ncbi:hypothetical protein PCANC_03240 [Puccinia coronata f. sp. avenae]|uniref:Uncharacterized protein n=1 Tax=Puccinia coronata f. sp. avenae TaxID=200324 RepID=A0A2N5UCL9_9BASI|nr:hypothetical protein PCASD_18965 [Puccinia coronata f. sp. avenae]PLW35490.1 hypothetical protein PCASD_12715 [Puccinia coronata f. sp. avenae]PLW55228.1 hypothetical protein PCANC_03240 [Puccinia coronata f. sp. avenae]
MPSLPEATPEMIQHNSVKSHPDNIYAQAGQPACFNTCPGTAVNRCCFRCGSMVHFISQCNALQAPSVPFSSSTAPTSTIPGPSLSFSCHNYIAPGQGFIAHYPVLTPAGALYNLLWPSCTYRPAAPLRAADSYRPMYCSQGTPSSFWPSARKTTVAYIDINGTPINVYPQADVSPGHQDVSFSIATSNPPNANVLFDTGTTHHITGYRARYSEFLWPKLNNHTA